jgi:2-polyprenyl-3-methyl-5-hydroxy-6-metoxy-1,4-benzoquinol methylase
MSETGYDRAVRPVRPDDGAESVAREAATPCAVCSAREARARFAIEGTSARLVECTRCGTGRLDPMPDEDELGAFYPAEYYGEPGAAKFHGAIEQLVRLAGERHVRFFLSGLAPGARVLDVGCGRGVLLSEIARRGFEAHGVERSEEAARGADPRARIHIAPSLADAALPASSFDEVIVWHVLEHLRDPRATLAEIHRVLRPGGTLIVAVPNFSSAQARWAGAAWFHLDLPRHLHHFPVAALRGLLEESGFRCAATHHFSLRQNPFGWIQSALNRDASLPRNGLYTLLHRRHGGEPPFDPRTRRRLLARGALLAPLALALSLLEAVARSGATVHVVARRAG